MNIGRAMCAIAEGLFLRAAATAIKVGLTPDKLDLIGALLGNYAFIRHVTSSPTSGHWPACAQNLAFAISGSTH
ncbi:protein of unknown function [Candidatus Filomicrobium marinum]|uniref:Uncharacterized protein n=1 Tax=Candidatus Filomicrobium marinum TaxID=1608628 RepID=A0A0D6JI21_9HYPH|nr:protein of unknown function [Candidatus Filomicrobium marinum]